MTGKAAPDLTADEMLRDLDAGRPDVMISA
jgi:hypothetical protein